MPTKEDVIRVEGCVVDVLPNTNFKVEISNGQTTAIICHLSGKMRKNNIRVLMHDKVDVELSLYDLTKGRIVYRHK